jgi:hypothetical protein
VSPASNSFLPEDYIARKTATRMNILILGLFTLVLGGVVAAFVVTNRHWHEVRDRQKNVNEQWSLEGKKMDQLKALEGQRAQMMEKAEITAALVEHVPRWAVLGEVTLRMPQDMRLDSMIIKSTRTDPVVAPPKSGPTAAPLVKSLTDKITGAAPPQERPKVLAPKFTYALTIVGSTPKNTDVADFLASLKSSPIFNGVELTYIREAKEKDRDLRKFEIVSTIRSDTDTGVLANSLQKLISDRTNQADSSVASDAKLAGPRAPADLSRQASGADKGGN